MADPAVHDVSSVFLAALDIPGAIDPGSPREQREYLCGGELRHWDGALKPVFSPVCVPSPGGAGTLERRLLGHYPDLGEAEALAALDAARAAWSGGRGAWPTMPVAERLRHVEDFTHRMVARRAEVVNLLMWEVAKPLEDAGKEFDRTVQYIRDTVDAVKDLDRASSRFVDEQGILAQIRRAPLGVVLCMGPFNYPLNETFTTLIPALVMGNPTVVKPPRYGILLWRPLLDAFREAFPPGVVNVVYGEGRTVAAPLVASGGVDVLAFIGSSGVADTIKRQHPRPHRLRSVLGLDAKNPAIILADADLELTVAEVLTGTLSFNGQRCTALKAVHVDARIADDFLARFADAMAGLRRGMPWEPGVAITPLPEAGKPEKLKALVDDAVAKGARQVNPTGGSIAATYFEPAIVDGVAPGMELWDQEQFGPVVSITRFADVEEPLGQIVASNFGQQCSVFGCDPGLVARLCDTLVNQVCRVNLNSQCQRGPDTFPFTGRKDSAEGTLSVTDALRVFSIRTLVAAKGSEANKRLLETILRERRSSFLSTDFIF